jgi:alpha-beta hydrolase superfamily lysophospholipase
VTRAVLAALCAALLSATAAPAAEETPPCLEPGDGTERVSFAASDGVTINGLALGEGKVGVVLGHQMYSSYCEWYEFAQELAGKGYAVLAIDFRGYGTSRAPARGSTTALDADVRGAAAELRRRGSTRVVAIGASMGGTAVVVAASRPRSGVDGVVSLSGPARFVGLNAQAAVKRLVVPARFVAAKLDGRFPGEAKALSRATRSKDKALLLLPGAGHGSSLLARTDTGPRTRTLVFALLAKIGRIA